MLAGGTTISDATTFLAASGYALSMLAGIFAFGGYSIRMSEMAPFDKDIRLLTSFFSGMIIYAFLSYILPTIYLGRGVLIVAIPFAASASILIRRIFNKFIDFSLFTKTAVLRNELEENPNQDEKTFDIILEVNHKKEIRPKGQKEIIDLAGYLLKNKITVLLIDVEEKRNTIPMRKLMEVRTSGIRILMLNNYIENTYGRVHISDNNLSIIVFGAGFYRTIISEKIKRLFDIIASGTLLISSSPLILAALIGIKIEEGYKAPLFYSQIRSGLNGKQIKIWKIRSMREDAEKNGAKFTEKNDPRVTKVGKIIRKTRIDELPQLISILKGDMSLVGPRPERPVFVEQFNKEIPWYNLRNTVKPGLAGWAQLNQGYPEGKEGVVEKLKYDLFYIQHQSLIMDILILLQTIEVVLFGRGAR